MAYEIKIENLRELQDAFKKAPAKVGKELEKATKNAGKDILRIEKEEVPVKTATLKRSITLSYRPISASIYPTVKYALPVHNGSRPHTILPVRKKILAFKKNGRMIFAKRVNHPGTKGNKFVERTVSRAQGGVSKLFESALDNIINFLTK